jgi:hypothetical protein
MALTALGIAELALVEAGAQVQLGAGVAAAQAITGETRPTPRGCGGISRPASD